MINAVILLNDDIDEMSECRQHSGKSAHSHKSNLFFLLSVSIPKPLFPIAGYPIIFHHIRRLSEMEQVRHVFLIGNYEQSKFTHFIEEILT
mmetsp:Transcript_10698/g.10813  ORF Transcript_10698/g.10813 Transcript_10698/m.10813 type:complete len:91 (+) Transcript_10698:3-275(+)